MLSGAGLAAHGITALAMPVLSRLYSPADFGLLSVLTSTLGVLNVAACLRYELAIPLPGEDRDADHLLALSLVICTTLSLVLGCAVWLQPDALADLLHQPDLTPHLWMIPLGLWCTGCYLALQVWHVRHAAYPTLARTRVGQSAASAGLQMTGGALGLSPQGLLLGPLWNAAVACLALCRPGLQALRRMDWPSLRRLAIEHRRFPLYSTGEAVANSAALYLPVIFIAAHVGAAEAGCLGMAMYVAQAPMSLIGTSISQVFLSRAAQEHREGRIGQFTGDVLDGLVKAGVGPLLALGILAPQFCGLLFGAGWERTGWLVSWMTPWFLMQFLVVPLSTALHICGRQRAALLLQLAGLALRLGGVWLLAHWGVAALSEVYAVSGLVFYGLYLLVVLRATRTPVARLVEAMRHHAGLIALWVGAASVAAVAMRFVVSGG